MKKSIYLLLLSLFVIACDSSNDPAPIPSVLGITFQRTSYVLQTPLDGNGDGIFSTDIYNEIQCPAQMTFLSTGTVENPLNSVVYVQVTTDFNQQLTQSINCVDEGTSPALFEQDGFQIRFTNAGQLLINGELSDDGSQISFTIPRANLIGFDPVGSNNILNENGSTTSYNGNAVVTYTRQ